MGSTGSDHVRAHSCTRSCSGITRWFGPNFCCIPASWLSPESKVMLHKPTFTSRGRDESGRRRLRSSTLLPRASPRLNWRLTVSIVLALQLSAARQLLEQTQQPYSYLVESVRQRDAQIRALKETVSSLEDSARYTQRTRPDQPSDLQPPA